MKKVLAIFLVLCMLAAFAGCRVRQKIGEKILENMIGNAGGGDVDIDGDSMTIKGEDGSTTTIGGTKWPDSEFAKNIPEFKEGTISYVMESTDYTYVTIESVKEKDAEAYVETIKQDYNVDPYEMNAEGSFTYTAKNDDGLTVSIMYSEDETLLIMLGVS